MGKKIDWEKYYKEVKAAEQVEYSREHAWQLCHGAFHEAMEHGISNQAETDQLCLHLAIYLATFGMYRGKAFLLQHDYFIHREVVRLLLQDDYLELRDLSIKDLENEAVTDKIMELIKAIKGKYVELGVVETTSQVSNILVTKILLGTLCCIPAYDGYFQVGLHKVELKSFSPCKKSFGELKRLYDENEASLKPIFGKLKEKGIPEMRVLDAIMWQIGAAENE